MAFKFSFYADPALTTPINAALLFVQDDTAPVPADKLVWFGSPDANKVCEAVAAPGVTPIVVSVVDALAGSASPPTDVKLALSAADLAIAVGGAALALPATIQGGVDSAIEIHIRVTDSTHAVGVKTDLSLSTNPLVQS